ncbi:MAG: serine protease [Bacteroidetes bacterium CG23_combo_of_CG06-09_8_20_14_all_32_9]|nr:MAG: serine protease [Bacteroidetes bacterium CG23_combo_of_CG06-09_8_20_14_all_32_9]
MKKFALTLQFTLSFFLLLNASIPQNNDSSNKPVIVYQFDILQEIGPSAWRQTQKAFELAGKLKAGYMLIHLNTYGGLVDAADSIRTKILNSPIPVYVFIDNNAASAGALISIACNKIFMRKGANIGAATVVTGEGKAAPDKYQAYMRSIMRSTAQAHGKITVIENGDTIQKWFRDPHIAEAMVDESIYIAGITDTGKVITFTTNEAIKYGFCEGEAETIDQALQLAEITNYKIEKYQATFTEKIIDFLINPIIQGLLIMLIIGGIYFELQTPGIGFPLAAAFTGAILYFAPLYLEGLAENWEILIFVAGVILLLIEIFAIPGFGVTGILGILCIVTGLTLSMIDNIVFNFEGQGIPAILKSLSIVIISCTASFFLSLYLGQKIFTTNRFGHLSLETVQNISEGYIGVEMQPTELVGKTGKAATMLRPGGKIEIDNEIYDAVAETGYIDKGDNIVVVKYFTGQLYVRKKQ